MYNLQKAKEEIDIVAKHTSVLTEHVIAVSERLQALEGALATKLNDLKTLIGTIEGKFADLQGAVVGGEPHHFETSAISDLASKLALLKPAPAPAHDTAHEPIHDAPHEVAHAEPSHGYVEHNDTREHGHQPTHDDTHGGDYHHG